MMIRFALTQTTNVAPIPSQPDALRDALEAIRLANVNHHVTLMREAHRRGAQAIGFGELFTAPYFALSKDPVWLEMAEPINGPTVQRFQEMAASLHMVVVAPIYEWDPTLKRRFNTAVFIDADGSVLGHYSKTHIPNGQNEQGVFAEGFYFEASVARPNPHPSNISKNPYFPVFQTAVGPIGAAICYDRHFDGVMRTLAHEGARLVFSPAVTFGEKSERMWSREFQVDACRHRLFIAGSNRCGTEAPWDQPFFGRSRFVSPDGRLPDQSDHPELILSDLNLNALTQRDNAGWKLQADRKPAIYSR